MSSAPPSHAAQWTKSPPLPAIEVPRPLSGIPPPEEYVALDCEFVGVGPNNLNALGRCSIINFHGQVLYDRVVLPQEPITDFRTRWSGLRPTDMFGAIPFAVAQSQIEKIIKHRIVIGHAVFNDFRVMNLEHPQTHIRDTSQCQLLQMRMDRQGILRARSLRDMTQALLGRKIQCGEHDSVEDARAALDLYKLVRDSWELPRNSRSCTAAQAGQPRGTYAGPTFSAPPAPAYSCAPQSVMVSVRPPPVQYVPVTYFDDRYWPVNGGM